VDKPLKEIKDGPIKQHSARGFPTLSHSTQALDLPTEPTRRKLTLDLPPCNSSKWREVNAAMKDFFDYHLPYFQRKNLDIDTIAKEQSRLLYQFLAEKFSTKSTGKPKISKPKESHRFQKLKKQKLKLKKNLRNLRKKKLTGKASPSDFKLFRDDRAMLSKVSRDLSKLIKQKKSNEARIRKLKEQNAFNNDRWKYAKSLFISNSLPPHEVSCEDAQKYFQQAYHDEERSYSYDPPVGLQRRAFPQIAFDMAPPSRQLISKLLAKKSNNSAPGPNGIPYKVYKKVPFAFGLLFNLIKRSYEEKKTPKSWGHAFIVLLVKDENSLNNPATTRPIACTDVEGKIFWSFMNQRLRSFCTSNKIFSPHQKGALAHISGCLEHTWTLFEALKNAKKEHRQIVVTWFDLKNAYGSIRHNIIQFALKWYHIPESFAKFVFDYYDSLAAFVSAKDWNTQWFKYSIGVFQGCVISPTLFILVFQIILDFINQNGTAPYDFKIGKHQQASLSQNAYMDDHTLVTSTVEGMRFNIGKLNQILSWSHALVLKPSKCWCLALGDTRFKHGENKGKSFGSFDPHLFIDDSKINFIGENFFKFLGRRIYADLKHGRILDMLIKTFEKELAVVDKSQVSGASKAWIFQHMCLQRLVWPFMIYPLSVTNAQEFEKLCNKFLKKWYNTHKGFNPSLFYLPKEKRGWGLTSPVTVLKSIQVSAHHILKSSKDELTQTLTAHSLNQAVKSISNTWNPQIELHNMEKRLNFELNFGLLRPEGRLGLGFQMKNNISKSSPLWVKRHYLAGMVKKEETKKRIDNLRDLALAGQVVKWDNIMANQLDWNEQIKFSSSEEIKFVMDNQCGLCPSPSNLIKWGYKVSASCGLCKKKSATTLHILNNCVVALRQGRYTWRHDNVLRVLQLKLKKLVIRANKGKLQRGVKQTHFVKAGGEQPYLPKFQPPDFDLRNRGILLCRHRDWKLEIDFNKSMIFPPCTGVITKSRPDIVIYSKSGKEIIMAELTCPIEECVHDAELRKKRRYKDLVNDLRLKDWNAHLFTIEVGSFGWLAFSVRRFLTALGLHGEELRFMYKRLSRASRRSSFFIWTCRSSSTWNPPDFPDTKL
jgi:hypothetical protein